MRLIKMKTIAIILIILAVGLVITGCSSSKTTTLPPSTNTQSATTVVDDLNTGDTVTNPDIGTLDNVTVSDTLPQ